MSSSKLFQQLFNEGKQLFDNNNGSLKEKTTRLLKDKNINAESAKKMASGFGGGMAAGGILGSILGSKKGREYAGTTAKWGSLAALGGAAYYAYQKWQSEQKLSKTTNSPVTATTTSSYAPVTIDMPAEPVVKPETQLHTDTGLLFDAMVSAARADGHIDDKERQNITEKLQALGIDDDSNKLIASALNKPLDPEALAARVTTIEQACEVYLISYAVIDANHFMEKAYLDALEKQLNLPADLIAQLKQQV